jgi:hypothetical protein
VSVVAFNLVFTRAAFACVTLCNLNGLLTIVITGMLKCEIV